MHTIVTSSVQKTFCCLRTDCQRVLYGLFSKSTLWQWNSPILIIASPWVPTIATQISPILNLMTKGDIPISLCVSCIRAIFTHAVCDPALEISDEVHQSNPVDSLEICCDPEKMYYFWRQEDPGMLFYRLLSAQSYVLLPCMGFPSLEPC